MVPRSLLLLPVAGCFVVLDYGDYSDMEAAGSSGNAGEGGGCTPAECYSGPPETKGVGRCRAGTTTCASDACEMEVLPETELCGDALDEDCDDLRCDPLRWLVHNDDAEAQAITAMTLAPQLVVAGWYEESIQLGNRALTRIASGEDYFVAMLDHDGGIGWLVGGAGVGSRQRAHAISADASEVLVAGEREAQGDEPRGFVVQHQGSDGAKGSEILFDATGETRATALTHSTGFVYVAGSFAGDMTVGSTQLSSTMRDLFVVKLTAALTPATSIGSVRNLGGEEDDEPLSIAAGDNGLIVVGRYRRVMGFPEPLVPSLPDAGAQSDAFVFLMDTNNVVLWAHGLVDTNDSGEGWAAGAASDAGGPVVVGAIAGMTDLSGQLVDVVDAHDAFIVRYDVDGNYLWHRVIGGAGEQRATDVAMASDGSIFVTGVFDTEAQFIGGEVITAQGAEDMFLAKLDAQGGLTWLRSYATRAVPSTPNLRLAIDDGLYFGGSWTGTFDFGGPSHDGGSKDAFVARFEFADDS